MKNTKVLIARIPDETYPKENNAFKMAEETIDIAQVKDGEVLVSVRWLSIDAAMRVWISGIPTYMGVLKPGDLMPASGIAEIIYSKNSKFNKGDLVMGIFGFT